MATSRSGGARKKSKYANLRRAHLHNDSKGDCASIHALICINGGRENAAAIDFSPQNHPIFGFSFFFTVWAHRNRLMDRHTGPAVALVSVSNRCRAGMRNPSPTAICIEKHRCRPIHRNNKKKTPLNRINGVARAAKRMNGKKRNRWPADKKPGKKTRYGRSPWK